jgi:hypothetical protein
MLVTGDFPPLRVSSVAIRVPKNRVLAFLAILLVGALMLLCRMTVLRPSLEETLNVFWLGLATGSFIAWICRRDAASRSRTLGLLALVSVFALLFPVISPTDDLAQPLDNDACTTQLVLSGIKAEKHVAAGAGVPAAVVFQPSILPTQQRRAEIVTFSSARSLSNAIRFATGNHSPPHP